MTSEMQSRRGKRQYYRTHRKFLPSSVFPMLLFRSFHISWKTVAFACSLFASWSFHLQAILYFPWLNSAVLPLLCSARVKRGSEVTASLVVARLKIRNGRWGAFLVSKWSNGEIVKSKLNTMTVKNEWEYSELTSSIRSDARERLAEKWANRRKQQGNLSTRSIRSTTPQKYWPF